MNTIIYPTVDLFLYDLRDGLGDNSETLEENWDKFKQKMPKILHERLKFDSGFESEYEELLPKKNEFYQFSNQGYEGFYYPVRMSDMYGLLLDCSVSDELTAQPAKCIKQIKAEIKRRLGETSAPLGQTWLIYGQLPHPGQNPQDVAQICYKALFPWANWQDDFQGQGHLLGGTVFELDSFKLLLQETANKSEDFAESKSRCFDCHHVIIVLYPTDKAAKAGAELMYDWMRLFAYRAKILWAYGQTRELKQYLKQDYITIQDCLRQIRGNEYENLPLSQLKAILNQARSIVSDYTIDVDELGYQLRTIAINLDNYKKRIEIIAKKLTSEEFSAFATQPSDIAFLANFSNLVTEKYLLQVEKDYENLSPGLQRLEFAIATIRGLVEVDRARQERRFQNNITIFGWGLAAAAIAASLSAQFPYVIVPVEVLTTETTRDTEAIASVKPNPSFPTAWVPPVRSLGYSLVAGLLFMAIAWLWIKRKDQ
ncbi:hypothetical protein [Oscillatoria sp. HE19RPO]|uniref:hypothetical protein n=1 Tax=Oscillatoria sp. HE19RPO TaxID=2954806 RepID=UPI0020C2305E|nr:hypothetical protein [Oscillatoria sp. HE19RPO]